MPSLDYCDTVWDSQVKKLKSHIERVQKSAARMITNTSLRDGTSTDSLYKALELQPLDERRTFYTAVQTFRAVHSPSPSYISNLFQNSFQRSGRSLRNNHRLDLPIV